MQMLEESSQIQSCKNLIYRYFLSSASGGESGAQKVLLGAEKTRGKVGDGHEGIYF